MRLACPPENWRFNSETGSQTEFVSFLMAFLGGKNLVQAQEWLSGEIVTTGSELLLGQIVDTNAAWMAQSLNEIGIHLYFKSTVGDNEQRLCELLQTCMKRSNVVVVTGGLGPTADDITRQALARAVGVPLIVHTPTLESLRQRFSNWGTKMTANNQQQALLPEGAEIVPNPVGTAPGIRIETGDCVLFALPGVPREMKHLMTESVLPFLRERTGGQGVIRTRTLRTIGIGESTLDHELGELLQSPNPTVGLAAHTGQADVRITARGRNEEEVEILLDNMECQVREAVGKHVYSDEKDKDIARAVAELLESHGQRLILLEQHTGGHIASRLKAGLDGSPLLDPECVRLGLSAELESLFPVTVTKNDLETALTEFSSAFAELSPDVSCMAVLGTSNSEHGVYQRERGMTSIIYRTADGESRVELGFGGTDEFTVTWIGNRCLDLIRREILGLR